MVVSGKTRQEFGLKFLYIQKVRSKPGVKELYLPDKNYKLMYYTWGPQSQKD